MKEEGNLLMHQLKLKKNNLRRLHVVFGEYLSSFSCNFDIVSENRNQSLLSISLCSPVVIVDY